MGSDELKIEQFARDLQGILKSKYSQRKQLDVIRFLVNDALARENNRILRVHWIRELDTAFLMRWDDYETNDDSFLETYSEIKEIIFNQVSELPEANEIQVNQLFRKKVVSEKIEDLYRKVRHPLIKNQKKILTQIQEFTREQLQLNSTPYNCNQCQILHQPEMEIYEKHIGFAQIKWNFKDLIYSQIDREIRIRLDSKIRENHKDLLKTMHVQDKINLQIDSIPSKISSISRIKIEYQNILLGFIPKKEARIVEIAIKNGDFVICVIGGPPEEGNLLISIGTQKKIQHMFNVILELVELRYPNMECGIFRIGYGVVSKMEDYVKEHPNPTIQKLIKSFYAKQETILSFKEHWDPDLKSEFNLPD